MFPFHCSLQQVPEWPTTFGRFLIPPVNPEHKHEAGSLWVWTFHQRELEFRQYSFNHIGRVLQNRLGVAYLTSTCFSSMLCSPRPFRGAFRAMVVVTRMTLLLMLTNKSFLWKRYKCPFHGAQKRVTRCHLMRRANEGSPDRPKTFADAVGEPEITLEPVEQTVIFEFAPEATR